MRLGPFLLMRYGPLIGYTAGTRKIITVAGRYATLTEAVQHGVRFAQHRGGVYWVCGIGHRAHSPRAARARV